MNPNKIVTVFEEENYHLPTKASKFLAFWTEKLETIPEEFRDTAHIEVEADSDCYGCASLGVAITYTRPITDREKEARAAYITLREEKDKASKLAKYIQLKQELNL